MKLSTLPIYILCVFSACSLENKQTNDMTYVRDTTIDFKKMIFSIDSQVIDLTATADLSYSAQYREIFQHPKEYYRDAIIFIKDPSNSIQQKHIVAYSMGILDVEDYVSFVEIVYDEYKKGTVHANLLEQVIYYQYPSPSNKIVVNYRNNRVRALLKRIKSDKVVSHDFIEVIDQILSGDLLDGHKAVLEG